MSRGARRTLAPLLFVALTLSGCASMKQTYKDNPKAVLGGGIGALAGAGIAAIAGGNPGVIVASAVVGGALGGYIGHRLDNKDKKKAAEAAQRAFENGQTGKATVWSNPDSGNSGSYTPTKTYQLANGSYCREYREEITVGNEKHQAYGTACRQPDGSWKIQS